MKILILTATSGNGHNSTAKRIAQKLKEMDENVEIKMSDVYRNYANKLTAWTMNEGYFIACTRLTGIYNFFFKKAMKDKTKIKDKAVANKTSYKVTYGLYKDINEFCPDVIICTYFLAAVAIENLKRVYPVKAKVICMTLDYGVSPYWECCAKSVDYMFLTHEGMREIFINKGYSPEKLTISGTPIGEKFFSRTDKRITREKLGLNQDLFTVLVMKGSFFPVSCKRLIKEFAKIKTPLQIIVINGHSTCDKRRIDRLIQRKKLPHSFVNIGFTDYIPDYFASADIIVGKGGGLSTTEAIASNVPLLITTKLPEQELLNSRFLVGNGCAVKFTNRELASIIVRLINSPKEYQAILENQRKFQFPSALQKICDCALSCEKQDYNPQPTVDKKTLLNGIDKARKLAIKENKKNKNFGQ